MGECTDTLTRNRDEATPVTGLVVFFSFQCYCDHRDLHSFPTRRSSDLGPQAEGVAVALGPGDGVGQRLRGKEEYLFLVGKIDRKSTRLNSSHMSISYAVFCLKKKKGVASLFSRARCMPI